MEREATVGDLLAARSGVYQPYLLLRRGRWAQGQGIPADSVHQITSVVTAADEVARTSPFTSDGRLLLASCHRWLRCSARDP